MNDNRYYRNFYDKQSEHWDALYKTDEQKLSAYSLHHRERMRVIHRMVARLPKHEAMKALDVGCGPGAYLPTLFGAGYEVCAFDQSEEMLARARANVPSGGAKAVQFHCGDIQALPYEDGAFDLALCIGVIMYVNDDAKALVELSRVVRPGGQLIIAVDNKKNVADLIDFPMRARNLLRRLVGKKHSNDQTRRNSQGVHPRCYSPREIDALLRRAGFSVVSDASVGIAPILLNGRRIFSQRTDAFLERNLRGLIRLPLFRRAGYIYLCMAKRTDSPPLQS